MAEEKKTDIRKKKYNHENRMRKVFEGCTLTGYLVVINRILINKFFFN